MIVRRRRILRIFQSALLLASLSLLTFTPQVCADLLPRPELFKIIINGVEGASRENVEAILTIPHGMLRNGHVEPVWAKNFARKAKERTVKALEPLGYYEPSVKTRLTREDNGSYILTVDVDPGEPVTVTQREILISGAGQEERSLVKRLEAFPLNIGSPLQHNLYDESKGALLEAAISLGYLDAHFPRHKIRVYKGERKAEISLELATGPRYSFGEIEFHGAEDIPPKVLNRYLTFKTGEPFSDSELALTQTSLIDSDRFSSSQVKALHEQSQDLAVPVRIDLVPRPRYQLRPGLGYGTDTGPRASLSFRNSNTFKQGHEFLANLLVAELRQTVSGRYLVPLAAKKDSLMAFSLQYSHEDNDIFEATTTSTEASLSHGFIKGLGTDLYISLSQEEYEIGGEPSQTTTLVMPGARINQRRWTFDSPGNIRKGYFWQLEVRGASAALGSDVSVLQGIIGANTIFKLSEKMSLFLRGDGGTTIQNDFNDLPPSLRLFAGGDQSVRGYAYKSLGPKDADGNTVGGRHLAVGSVEIEYSWNEDWGAAIFYDIGNAFDTIDDFTFAQGAGIGVRRHTPIGPIKVDLARQLGDDNNSYRLHLSVGFGW